MNYLLSWLFEHIKNVPQKTSVKKITDIIIASIAEVDGVKKITLPLDQMTLIEVVGNETGSMLGNSRELELVIPLPDRNDVVEFGYYLIIKEKSEWRWASMADVGGTREYLLPCFAVTQDDARGAWKNRYKNDDYIIQVDNKSIGHRPDLWGHRGLARDIAALLGYSVVTDDSLLSEVNLVSSNNKSQDTIRVYSSLNECPFIASALLPDIRDGYSCMDWAIRLAQLDIRPKSMIIDATNYVMFDYGHPLHAFDSEAIDGYLEARLAHNKEELSLLDGSTVILHSKDIVVADSSKALSLAGIMGGYESSINRKTSSVCLEAAVFDGTFLRNTSNRLNKRTESSVRFEKELEPYGAICALRRCIKLLIDYNVISPKKYTLSYTGELPDTRIILLEHALLTTVIGDKELEIDRVKKSLEAMGCIVFIYEDEKGIIYQVSTPPYRSLHDLHSPEDLIEEVARFIGYNSIIQKPPSKPTTGFSLKRLHAQRAIKEGAVHYLGAHEVINYGIVNEEWFNAIEYTPSFPVKFAAGSGSQNQSLVDTLLPHMLKNIQRIEIKNEKIALFEIASVWHYKNDELIEKEVLTCVWNGTSEEDRDFYTHKNFLNNFFKNLGIDFSYKNFSDSGESPASFFSPYVAQLCDATGPIGNAGLIESKISYKVGGKGCVLFACEIEIQALYNQMMKKKPLQVTTHPLDITVLIPFEIYSYEILDAIYSSHPSIESASIIDWFDKPEWNALRSVTIRIHIKNKNDMDETMKAALAMIHQKGLQIR